jgi:hypothetical protein
LFSISQCQTEWSSSSSVETVAMKNLFKQQEGRRKIFKFIAYMHTSFISSTCVLTEFSDFLIHHHLVVSLVFLLSFTLLQNENILLFSSEMFQNNFPHGDRNIQNYQEESFTRKLSWFRIICNIGEIKFLSQKFVLKKLNIRISRKENENENNIIIRYEMKYSDYKKMKLMLLP